MRFTLILLAGLFSIGLMAQGVLIGPAGQPPHPSAYLEVGGNQGGFLLPRLTTTERNAIVSPAQGLQIFNLSTDCIETYFSTGWQPTSCGCTAAPSAPQNVSLLSPSFCPGDTVSFAVQPVPQAQTYQWTAPSGMQLLAGQDSAVAQFIISSSFSGNLEVQASNACGTGNSLLHPLSSSSPSAAFSPTTAAVNQPVLFQSTQPAAAYSWTFTGATPSSSNAATPSVTWNSTGTFAVTLSVTDANQCSATLTQNVNVSNCITGGSITLTNCGATGRSGPTQSQCNSAYGAGVVTVQNGLQLWTVPSGVCTITIDAYGAQGVDRSVQGGRGARIQGTFSVTPGQVLRIAVGQQGIVYGSNSGAGGGGTFVVDNSTNQPLVVAGGGGGAFNTFPGGHGLTTVDGGGPIPGINGNGGQVPASSPNGGSGAGFFSDGTGVASHGSNGQAFMNGALGGSGTSGGAGDGGFGGGGSQTNGGSNVGGGGGGYSGGGSSGSGMAVSTGGGGSINNGTNQTNTSGVRAGNGQVIISW